MKKDGKGAKEMRKDRSSMGKGWKDDGKRDRINMEKEQKRDGKETEEGW